MNSQRVSLTPFAIAAIVAITAISAATLFVAADQLGASSKAPATEEMIYKVEGEVRPPVRVFSAQPKYPASARQERIQGVVVVLVVIDRTGKVVSAEAVKDRGTDNQDLRQSAVESIEHWLFKPATLDGEPVAVYYHLNVNFRLDGAPNEQEDGGEADNPIYRVEGDVKKPVRVSGDPPAYPAEAKKNRTEGRVVVLVVIDRQGSVASASVVETKTEELGHAALAAVETWKFQPATLDGKPVPVYYHLTVNFRLKKDLQKPSNN